MCKSTYKILEWNRLKDVILKKDKFLQAEDIKWTQQKRCGKWYNPWNQCKEQYKSYIYKVKGLDNSPEIYVYAAEGDAPDEFSTRGYNKKLHLGWLIWDNKKDSVVFFVIHPNSWGPYQKRFKTSKLTAFVNKKLKLLISSKVKTGLVTLIGTAVASGATAGSVVPGPGTAAGAAIGLTASLGGYVAGKAADKYLGNYLRYIG